MGEVRAAATRRIPAAPEAVHAAVVDYREVRPALLPDAFTSYAVDEGGTGAGTRFHYTLTAGRRVRDYAFTVTEPEPGRRVVETDAGSSLVTEWTLAPAGASQTQVSITTSWQGAGGIGGFFERTFAPKALQRLYAVMLERLETRVGS